MNAYDANLNNLTLGMLGKNSDDVILEYFS